MPSIFLSPTCLYCRAKSFYSVHAMVTSTFLTRLAGSWTFFSHVCCGCERFPRRGGGGHECFSDAPAVAANIFLPRPPFPRTFPVASLLCMIVFVARRPWTRIFSCAPAVPRMIALRAYYSHRCFPLRSCRGTIAFLGIGREHGYFLRAPVAYTDTLRASMLWSRMFPSALAADPTFSVV